MKRRAAKFTAKARALTDPKPNFVSIVKAGANMTPFLSVKHDGNSQEDAMKIKTQRSDDHDIAGLKFSKETFKDEAAVKAWLDNGGYTDYTIEEAEYGFMVAGRTDLTDVKEVVADGVTNLVGKKPVELEAAKDAPEVQAEASPSVVATKEETPVDKSDNAQAETVQPVAKTAVKAELDLAQRSEILKSKGLYDIMDLGQCLYTLKWMVDADYRDLPEDQVSALKAAASSLLGVMDYFMKDALDAFTEAFKAAAAKEVAETPETKTETVETVEKTTDEEPKDEIAMLKEQVAALTASVQALVGKANEVSEEIKKEEEVTSTEIQRQTRKGADVSDQKPEAKPGPSENALKMEDLRVRGILGM